MRAKFKQLNYILSNGLYVVNAKFKKNSPLITLFITNFIETTRVVFDATDKKVIANKDGIDIPQKDIDGLMVALSK